MWEEPNDGGGGYDPDDDDRELVCDLHKQGEAFVEERLPADHPYRQWWKVHAELARAYFGGVQTAAVIAAAAALLLSCSALGFLPCCWVPDLINGGSGRVIAGILDGLTDEVFAVL